MATTTVDFKKTLDSYRARAGELRLLDVPDTAYLMVDGHGDPNTSTAFTDAITSLYPVAYKLKFASKRELGRDYVVPPLEGLWWADDMDAFTVARDKSRWDWTLMIMAPDWIDEHLVEDAVAQAGRGKDAPARLDDVRLRGALGGPVRADAARRVVRRRGRRAGADARRVRPRARPADGRARTTRSTSATSAGSRPRSGAPSCANRCSPEDAGDRIEACFARSSSTSTTPSSTTPRLRTTAAVSWARRARVGRPHIPAPVGRKSAARPLSRRYQRRELTFAEQRRQRVRDFLGRDLDDASADALFSRLPRALRSSLAGLRRRGPGAAACPRGRPGRGRADERRRDSAARQGRTPRAHARRSTSSSPPPSCRQASPTRGLPPHHRLSRRRSRCALMVGDSLPHDVHGALAAGLQAAAPRPA